MRVEDEMKIVGGALGIVGLAIIMLAAVMVAANWMDEQAHRRSMETKECR